SVGGRVLREMLELSEPEVSARPAFERTLRRQLAGLDRVVARVVDKNQPTGPRRFDQWATPFVPHWRVSKLVEKPRGGLPALKPVDAQTVELKWQPVSIDVGGNAPSFLNLHRLFQHADGLVWAAAKIHL